jgi:hypothetical protein
LDLKQQRLEPRLSALGCKIPSVVQFILAFETGYHYVAQSSLELVILLP